MFRGEWPNQRDAPESERRMMTAEIATVDTSIPTLRLRPGERLIREGRPLGVLRLRELLMWTFVGVLGVFTIPLLPALWWGALKSVSVHRYWLTDQRLVVRTGLIGYQLRSIPLDRVVDVSVRASWLDRILGVVGVEVRDMTGESGGGNAGVSKGARLLAVTDAARWTDAILDRQRAPAADGETVLQALRALVQNAA